MAMCTDIAKQQTAYRGWNDMTPQELKTRFPNASKSMIAANSEEHGPNARTKRVITPKQTKGTWRFVIPGAPMGKPRMTNRDRWAKRPAVQRYWIWKDHAKSCAPKGMTDSPLIVSWTAYIPIPKSWSPKKRVVYEGTLHQSKPDRDNIDKGILDALFSSDACVAGGTIIKRWDDGKGPRIEIEVSLLP